MSACIQCGGEFNPRHEQERICSDTCRKARTAERKRAAYQPAPPPAERDCLECGTPFTPANPQAKVCSDICRKARISAQRRASHKAKTAPKKPTRTAPKPRRYAKPDAAAHRRMAAHFDREISVDSTTGRYAESASDARERGRVRRRIEDILERRAEREADPLYQPAPTLQELAERFAGGGA